MTRSDRESIHILQQRASNLVTGSADWKSSTISLASQRSALSWAGIDPLDHVAQDVLPDVGDDDGESRTISIDDDDPVRRTIVLAATGSDGLQHSVTLAAILYFGSRENFVDQSVVTELDAPIKSHPAVDFQGSDGKHFWFKRSVSLHVQFGDESEATETEFLVVPYMGEHEPLFKVMLGAEWLSEKERLSHQIFTSKDTQDELVTPSPSTSSQLIPLPPPAPRQRPQSEHLNPMPLHLRPQRPPRLHSPDPDT